MQDVRIVITVVWELGVTLRCFDCHTFPNRKVGQSLPVQVELHAHTGLMLWIDVVCHDGGNVRTKLENAVTSVFSSINRREPLVYFKST